jgi:hypothetical protein
MARDDDKPPRVGVNDEDAFLGAPPRRPTGPSPFDVTNDGEVEGEVALEVLPQLARTTGSYAVVSKHHSTLAVAIAAGVVVALVAVYFLFAR